MKQKKSLPFR